jgi:hypothetical protein
MLFTRSTFFKTDFLCVARENTICIIKIIIRMLVNPMKHFEFSKGGTQIFRRVVISGVGIGGEELEIALSLVP